MSFVRHIKTSIFTAQKESVMGKVESPLTYKDDVQVIKRAILDSQSRAVRMVSGEQLSLYYGIGLYVSARSREGYWGTGAIDAICDQLRKELPGLRGFSSGNVRKMRIFAEYWKQFINCSPLANELQSCDSDAIIPVDSLSLQNWSPSFISTSPSNTSGTSMNCAKH